jgi:hypothetical protein
VIRESDEVIRTAKQRRDDRGTGGRASDPEKMGEADDSERDVENQPEMIPGE